MDFSALATPVVLSFSTYWLLFWGLAFLVFCLFQPKRLESSNSVGPKQVIWLGVAMLWLFAPMGLEWGLRPTPERAPTSGPGMPGGGTITSAAASEVQIGQPLPSWKAGGWIHAGAQGPETKGKIVVLDIWAMWCPFCKSTAPYLVNLAKKYKDKEVVFVSLTNLGEPSTRPFLDNQQIDWSSAYGVDMESLAKLGALNEAAQVQGYEVKPTLLVIDRAGKVVWSDNHARYRHQEPKITAQELESAIEKTLRTGS